MRWPFIFLVSLWINHLALNGANVVRISTEEIEELALQAKR